jgi:hypothetical protein
MKLFLGLAMTVIAQIIVWFQLNGQFKWDWFRDHKLLTAIFFSLPISILFVYGTDYLYQAMGQKVWTVRLVSFGSSILSFYILSSYVLGQRLDARGAICLLLSLLIILIQILWK